MTRARYYLSGNENGLAGTVGGGASAIEAVGGAWSGGEL